MSGIQGQGSSCMVRTAIQDQAGTAASLADTATDQAIVALVEKYAPALYRVAFSVCRNSAESEDAVQETFLRVLKHRNKLPAIRDARVWLVRITWNVVLDRKRRTKTRPETDDIADLAHALRSPGLGSDTCVIAQQGYARLLGLIDTLPSREREALLLSAMEELSTSELATVLGTTESSVRSRLFRARQQLARLLGHGEKRGPALPVSDAGKP